MRRLILIYIFTGLIPVSSFSWIGDAHRDMTESAMKAVLKLDNTKPLKKDTVFIKYDLPMNFAQSIFMNVGLAGGGGIVESFIGFIVDQTVWDDQMEVDTFMVYPPPGKPNMTLYQMVRECGRSPDDFDAKTGLIGEGDCLIGHIITPNGIGFADYLAEHFYNLAVKNYKKNKQKAYAYLGYATHYIEDAGIPLHTEADWSNIQGLQFQYNFHTYTEKWVDANWSRYKGTADSAAMAPMPVCDIRAMVRALAYETSPDITQWTQAWGMKGGGDWDSDDISKNPNPSNIKKFDDVVKRCIWRIVPRVSGLFAKFKQDVM